jgi:hypothetical protein
MYVEYHLLIVKMHVESSKSEVVSKNFHVICDVKLILGLPFIWPMLKCVHVLIKIAQSEDVFMTLWTLSHWPNKNYNRLYCQPFVKYEDPIFDDFNLVVVLTNFPVELDF